MGPREQVFEADYEKTTIKELRDMFRTRGTTFTRDVELTGSVIVERADLGDVIRNEDEVVYAGYIFHGGEGHLNFLTKGKTRDDLLDKLHSEKPFPYARATIRGEYIQRVDGSWDTEIRLRDYLILESLQLQERN